MAVQRAGAAQTDLPRRHQADPQELPQPGSSIFYKSTPFESRWIVILFEKYRLCVCVLQVIILDPIEESTTELLGVAEMFYANNIPLRFVLVITDILDCKPNQGTRPGYFSGF